MTVRSAHLAVRVELATERLLSGSAEAEAVAVGAEVEFGVERRPTDPTQTLVSDRRLEVVFPCNELESSRREFTQSR